MRKFEIDHLKDRIEETVRCVNGKIATVLEGRKIDDDLDNNVKLNLIRSGIAKLKSDHDLHALGATDYKEKHVYAMLDCFEYPVTDDQQTIIDFNASIDARKDEAMLEVELEGKRLLDKALLNIIEMKDFPNELHKLGEMAKIVE